MEWRAATIETVSKIVEDDLKSCGGDEAATFSKYRVEPYLSPITRYGRDESVVVVARRQNEVIYWEDVEEGFNRSPVRADGRILEHLCNQDDLRLALYAWVHEDRNLSFSET
jgi:hypothetical protein